MGGFSFVPTIPRRAHGYFAITKYCISGTYDLIFYNTLKGKVQVANSYAKSLDALPSRLGEKLEMLFISAAVQELI